MSSDNTKDNVSTNDNNKTTIPLPVTPPSPVTTSSQQTKFSRSALKDIPEQGKRKYIDLIIRGFTTDLQTAAATSKSFYTYVIQDDLPHKITKDDLVNAFLNEFDGCDISYRETTTTNAVGKRILVKTIVIDWS
jgi:hypothetical protein